MMTATSTAATITVSPMIAMMPRLRERLAARRPFSTGLESDPSSSKPPCRDPHDTPTVRGGTPNGATVAMRDDALGAIPLALPIHRL